MPLMQGCAIECNECINRKTWCHGKKPGSPCLWYEKEQRKKDNYEKR